MRNLQIALWTIISLLVHTRGQSSSTEKLTDVPSEDFVDRGQDGSYRFGYKNNDRGEHYHSSAASADNTVSGRYGYRDPAAKRIVQTTYTAGERGFRANGPNIARKMNLGQTKIAYQPPVPIDSPNYRPTYDGYHNPNEDPTYDFKFKTATYSRDENSDSKGAVTGSFSYVDDVGKRHDVRYEADSRNGFNVKTPFPDSDPFNDIFYRGPNKPGTLPRGHTAIVRSNDGSYKFTSSGPDQRRTEISDSIGRVRGSYTYIDDKGVQRTVQYVAGPNIGYKVIRKGAGPVYSSVYPYARPEFINPTLIDDASSKEKKVGSSDLDRNIPDIIPDDLSDNNDFTGSANDNRQFDDFPVEKYDKSKNPSRIVAGGNVGIEDGTRVPSDERNPVGNYFLPPGAAGYLTPYTGENKDNSSPESTFPEDDLSSQRKIPEPPFNLPGDERSKFSGKFSNYNENTVENEDFRKPFYRPTPSMYGRPTAVDGYDYTKPSNKAAKFFDGTTGQNAGGKGYSREIHYPRFKQQRHPNDEYLTTDVRSAATAVRAHVQSVDILPYGAKVPSPEDVMTQHEHESS